MHRTASQLRTLFRVCENERYGFIDIDGKLVIPYQFDDASQFSEGLARVTLKDNPWRSHSGFIDSHGEVVIGFGPPPGYEWTVEKSKPCSYRDFHEGRAGFWIGDASGVGGYIDRTGNAVVPAKFKSLSDFCEGLACIALPGLKDPNFGPKPTGFIDLHGEFAIPPEECFIASGFVNGMCVFSVRTADGEYRYGAMNRAGKVVIPAKYDFLSDFSSVLARAAMERKGQRKWGFVDARGECRIPFHYDFLGEFYDNLAPAQIAGRNDAKYGYIDPSGQPRLPFEFDVASEFSQGIALVVRKGRAILIDTTGSELAPIDVDPTAIDFVQCKNGFQINCCQSGSEDTRAGFVDRQGRVIIPFAFEWIEGFDSGLCYASRRDLCAYFNAAGEMVWQSKIIKKNPFDAEKAEFLRQYLHATNIEWQPMEDRWEQYSQIILFACRTTPAELTDWYQQEFNVLCGGEWDDGYMDIYFKYDEERRSVSICAADTSVADAAENLLSYVVSDRLSDLHRKHHPCILGAVFLDEN